MLFKLAFATLVFVASAGSYAQVPAPPSLPGQDRLREELVRSIEGKDKAAYAALLADDVSVFEDGKEIAGNKAAWMEQFGEKLSAEGVYFKVTAVFSSTGRLLYIEHFNSSASWGGEVPAHCCWSNDAVAYDVADGKISVIRRLRGGGTKLNLNSSDEE